MCHGLANFLNKRITSDTVLEIHGIQSEEGQALIADFPPRLQAIDSVYVIRNGRVYVRSAASIRLLLTMSGITPCGFLWHGSSRFLCVTQDIGLFQKLDIVLVAENLRGQGPKLLVRDRSPQGQPGE